MSEHRAYRIATGDYEGVFLFVSASTPAEAMEQIRKVKPRARAEDLETWGGPSGKALMWKPANHKDDDF